MKRIVLAAILATTAAAGFAFAEQNAGPPRHAGMWPQGDMTRDQARAKAAELFTRLDVNGDGKLDPADRAAQIARKFDRIDTDHNGQISRAEFMAMHDHAPNRDGKPGPGRDGMGPDGMGPDGMGPGGPPPPPPPGAGPEGPGQGGPGHGGPGGPPHGMHVPGEMMMMARMADTNHDGAISQAEFVAAAMKRFEEADTNHDGKLSQAEHQAARMMMHDMPPPPGSPPPPPPPPAN